MGVPAQVNATLTKVQTPAAGGDGYDGPEAADATLWQGSSRAYYRETRDRVVTGAGVDRPLLGQLIVDGGLVGRWRSGQLVTFSIDGLAAPFTRGVKVAPNVDLAAMPPQVRTVRLTLEDPAAGGG